MRGCSLFLDDEPVVLDGDVVHPDMHVDRPRAATVGGLR
jgi:hypothetical protein